MQQLNILVSNLGASQLAYFLAKNTYEPHKTTDVILFYEDMSPMCLRPKSAIMQMAEAWAQAGSTIATNLSTAAKLINFIGPKKKFFYVWDLEWLRGPIVNYDKVFLPIYTHPQLQLIARSSIHAKLIANCFNREVIGIVDNANMDDLISLCIQ